MWQPDDAAVAIVTLAALGRAVGIFAVKFRQLAYRQRAVLYPTGWRDRVASPEPFVLFALTVWLFSTHSAPSAPDARYVAVSVLGAAFGTSGIALMLWAVRSFPAVSSGHYILPEHEIVTRGPYGWVRHPLYAAALLIWVGIALTFRSAGAMLIALVYVLPAYWIYMRSEERMMRDHFGEPYRRYASEVGMLVPRPRPRLR